MMYVKIEGKPGYESPFKVRGSYSLGELLGAILPTFEGDVTVRVWDEAQQPKPEAENDGE